MTAQREPAPTFLQGGTLPPPGDVGRLARLLLGIGSLYVVANVIGNDDPRAVLDPAVAVYMLFAVYLSAYVVNIGFGIRLGQWPRMAVLAAVTGAGLLSWTSQQSLETGMMWRTAQLILCYVYGHLGISFLLAAAFRTPGCEMRSIPILLGRIAGRPARDHRCPGPIGIIDQWEERHSRRG
ncbi:hypothetical protein [Hyphobacterium sp.]|uniref:hypothetical protein n=1 Tax=Hyphobacterium sp. TaxID=2004662 RepID=UPI003B518527